MKREKNPNQKAFKIVGTKKQPAAAKPEEPVPEIDTAKAVAFAMSIAQQMKAQQRMEDEARKEAATITYQRRNQKYSSADLELFRSKLIAIREEMSACSASMQNTASLNEADDIEPDGGDGTSQTMRLGAISQIEKTNKSINEIDEALHRVEDGTYGVCMTCGSLIAKNRLLHSPFVKTCTACQQTLEQNS